MRAALTRSELRQVAGSCENSIELSSSIKGREFREYLSYYKI
jgi:hypothetical protein